MESGLPTLAIITKSELMISLLEVEARKNLLELKQFSDVDTFHRWVLGKKLHGVLVDFLCGAKASAVAREFLYTIERHLPVCRFRVDPKDFSFSGQIKSDFLAGDELLSQFIKKALSSDTGRQIRKSERIEKNLSIRVLESPNDQNQFITKDISSNGLFMIATQNSFSLGDSLKLEILELQNSEPFDAEVRWQLRWNQCPGKVPGVGIEFKKVTYSQQNALDSLLGLRQKDETELEAFVKTFAS
tara:strand:+ start:7482 stop:8213 length:732 start_codon:yes stop_codon:yes gene_type:complete